MRKVVFVIIFACFISKANSQTIDFTFETGNNLLCNPSTVIFKQTCTGNPVSFIWSFGNNQYSNNPIDSTSYTGAGTYTVKLIANFASTTLQLTKTIVINPAVVVAIGSDKDYICQPGTINFTSTGSGNIKNYEWDFGDGTAPVTTVTNTASHAFTIFDSVTVLIKATANSGCYDTASKIIAVKKPDIIGTVSRFRGCVPAVSNFTGDVVVPANSSVTNYTWDFGDGTPPFSSTTNNTATHTYTAVGDYFPSLTVTTSEGCTNAYFYNRFYFGSPPTNTVASPQTSPVCGSDSAIFMVHSTNGNRYFWQFGDGTSESGTDTIIKHKYNTIGNKSVRVKSYYNECDAPTVVFPMSIIGVIAKYGFANTCASKNTYLFSDSTSGIPTSRLWDFGDGVQLPNVVSPVHSFPVSGQFITTLSMDDAVTGCSDRISKTIYTAVPHLYTQDSAVCRNSEVRFSITNNYTDTSARYSWSIGDSLTGPVADTAITVDFSRLGNYNNYVVIGRGAENCPDTVRSTPFLVRGPKLAFTMPAEICLNTPLTIVNNSQPFIASDSVRLWYWNFGNTATNDSVFQPQPFQYTTASHYPVRLTAVDKNGCKDTLSRAISINPTPFLHITPARAVICSGESVSLIAFHNNDLLWSPANTLSCANCDTTIATPTVSTKYYGTATNSFNCTIKDSNFVEVKTPFAATALPGDIYICQTENTSVEVNPKGKKITWSPVAGISDPTSYNPVISPLQTTTYTITLADSAGCANNSIATVNIHVKAMPVVDAGPNKFYLKGTSYSFAPTYSNNISSYLWTPSAQLSCGDCPVPTGVANVNQKYFVKVTSDSGCVATDSVTIWVDCKSSVVYMPKAFTPDNNNLNDLFYPITIGIRSVIKFVIYNRQGQIMYEASNFSPNDKGRGWDGKFKGVNQSQGGYVYSMEIECETGERFFKRGSFLLIR